MRELEKARKSKETRTHESMDRAKVNTAIEYREPFNLYREPFNQAPGQDIKKTKNDEGKKEEDRE